MSERKIEKSSGTNPTHRHPAGGSLSSAPGQSNNKNEITSHHRHHHHHHQTKKFQTLSNTSHPKISLLHKAPKRNFLVRTTSVPGFSGAGNSKGPQQHDHSSHQPDDYIVEGHGTPTPSEKVSRWHRDIFLMSPSGPVGASNQVSLGTTSTNSHPRECICEQCMAEYGTYKLYNQMMQARGMENHTI